LKSYVIEEVFVVYNNLQINADLTLIEGEDLI
jgi:hypothetical protein